jgi:hypothetical protein
LLTGLYGDSIMDTELSQWPFMSIQFALKLLETLLTTQNELTLVAEN